MKYIEQFVTFAKTQYQGIVQIIRSDNAKELCKGPILAMYAKFGIKHERSYVGTPQQNDIVERKHRHLLEMASSLHFQSSVLEKLWGKRLESFVYLINRMALSILHKQSPYSRLFGGLPSFDHLRTFSCLCYAITLSQGRTKFQPRVDPYVFMCYPFGQKGYKLYNLVSHKIFISRDVVFCEKHFPFHIKPHLFSSISIIFTNFNYRLYLP